MPMYDYNCLDCGKESLVVLTLKQHETTKVTCPKCGSSKMQQLYYVVCCPHDQEKLTAC